MTTSMYEFPHLEVSSGPGRVHAQIIGKSALAKKLQSLLRLQEIVSDLSETPARLNFSRQADFVYWFIPENLSKIPDALKNYLKNSSSKLIIISFPDIPDELSSALDAGIDACSVAVKDIYGPGVADDVLSLIWSDLKTKFVINLPDDDATEIYPIYLDDAAAAIIKISFSTQTYGRSFYLSGTEKTTILSFSYRLREEIVRQTQKLPAINYTQTRLQSTINNQQLTIDESAATRDFLSWQPETDLSEGLSKLVNYLNPSGPSVPSNLSVPSSSQEGPVAGKAKHLKKKTTFPFRRGFVFPLALATLFAAATLSLPRLLDQLAVSLAGNSPARLARLEPIFSLLGRSQKFKQLQESAAFNQSKTQIAGLVDRLLQSIFADASVSQSVVLDELDSRSAALLLTPYSLPDRQAGLLQSGDWRQNLGLARELIPVARLALAGDQKKTFLIVLQNSAEIRPTGGFISSMAFITIQKGRLLDIDYQSVNQLDSQLVGQEFPPPPIKDYLGETNWLIRDANWWPDGRQAAKKIESLVSRSTGRRIDGTIIFTTPALQAILAKTGDIVSPDGSTWNQLNVVERLVYNDRVDPQTGQTQDPLVLLAKALEEFIKTNPHRQQIINGALEAIIQNDLLITSPDPAIAQILNNLQVDGSLPQTTCPSELNSASCISDQISIIDANLGVNKADYFVIKEHDISVSLPGAAQISSAITLRYYNSAGASAYPAGTYRNYVRVYLPQDSIITSVIRLSPEGLVAVPTDNLIEAGRKVIGWYMEAPVAGQEIFRLESTRPIKLVPQNQIAAYSLVVRKQPGTAVPTSISIDYPPGMAPLTVSDNVTAAGNKLLLNHSGEANLFLNVEFATTE